MLYLNITIVRGSALKNTLTVKIYIYLLLSMEATEREKQTHIMTDREEKVKTTHQ